MFISQVGLRSAMIHSAFNKIAGGSLQLIRRCDTFSCVGHCVCAPQDQKCPYDSSYCNSVTAGKQILYSHRVTIVIVWQLDLQLPMQLAPITTEIVSLKPVHGEVYSIQHYLVKFVTDLQQVSGFLRALWCPPPIKLTTAI